MLIKCRCYSQLKKALFDMYSVTTVELLTEGNKLPNLLLFLSKTLKPILLVIFNSKSSTVIKLKNILISQFSVIF